MSNIPSANTCAYSISQHLITYKGNMNMLKQINPYFVAELRDEKTGQLNAEEICKVFGYDKIDYEKVNEQHFLSNKPKNFDDVVFAQGRDALIRLAMAVARCVDPERQQPEEQLTAKMHAYMLEPKDSNETMSRLEFVRNGGAILLLEEIYGGVRKDNYAAKGNDDNEIADWLGLDRTELAAVARTTGLTLLEAIASARMEYGFPPNSLRKLYSLSDDDPEVVYRFDSHVIPHMLGGYGLLELYNLCGGLSRKGKREWVESRFGNLELVYRRPI